MRALEHIVVGWLHQALLNDGPGFLFVAVKEGKESAGIRHLKIIPGVICFVLVENIAVSHTLHPLDVKDRVFLLDIHGDALQAISDFGTDRNAVNAAALLEISKLGYLHAVKPYLPTQSPGALGGILPVVLHKADVVLEGIDAQAAEALQV